MRSPGATSAIDRSFHVRGTVMRSQGRNSSLTRPPS
jgi:hypothetical protein